MTQAGVTSCIDETKEQMRRQAAVLREYAKWRLVRGYVFPPSGESYRRQLMRDFLKADEELRLTERNLVLVLYRGLFRSGPAASQ